MGGKRTEQDFTLAVTFRADHETADAIRAQAQIAVDALAFPTTENVSELFRIGAEAVVRAAQENRV